MRSYFRLKLFVVMILFALVISFAIATTDHLHLREEVIKNNQFQLKQIEETIKYAILTTEKAFDLFDQETAAKMEANADYLIDLYKENPSFDEWNFQALQDLLGMDIYIMDEHYLIIYSSLEDDLGLDFKRCCQKLVRVLEQKKETGEMLIDGIDIEQFTGEVKKYSYTPTPDKKYMIELGYSLQDRDLFQEFNFLKTIAELEIKYSAVNEINLLNIGGYSLGKPVQERNKLSPERKEAFEQALVSQATTEVRSYWKEEEAIYRYIPYVSTIDTGTTRNKVLEIVYNDHELQAILSENKQMFMWRLFIVLMVTTLLSFLISRWVAKPMYLAFHDSLTGLQNRAAFDDLLATILTKGKGKTGLVMIDLDNFKMINDYLGHDQGDYLLQCVSRSIKSIVRKQDITFRWGGDEFMIIMPDTSYEEAEQISHSIISSLQDICTTQIDLVGEKVTVSIGIAFAPEHGLDPDTLCKKADLALYASKEKGKNQFQVYTGN